MQSESGKSPQLYPLLLEPIFKYRIWGGRQLEQKLGKKLPPHEPVGESWEISCREDDYSRISNGDLAGATLGDLFKKNKKALVGPSLGNVPKFPLLNKFIDAQDLLSVQVHPDENTAVKAEGAEAKTEAWFIMHADPGATLIKGLRPGVTREIFEEAILNDTIPTVLNSIPVSTGDMVFVPAGCVHAMGKGLVVCEIQQNSDTTYRVYDWGRVGPGGKPRKLHIEQALEAINFEDDSPDKVRPIEISEGENKRIYLMACPHFAIQSLTMTELSKESTGGKRFDALMFSEGTATIQMSDGFEISVSAGDSVLVPACAGDYAIVPADSCTLLKIFVPDIEAEIVQKLRASGCAEDMIKAVIFE
jgi:mannose-6-phosphate isomerase